MLLVILDLDCEFTAGPPMQNRKSLKNKLNKKKTIAVEASSKKITMELGVLDLDCDLRARNCMK